MKNLNTFAGQFLLIPQKPDSDKSQAWKNYYFGVMYEDWDKQGLVEQEHEIQTEGFFIVKPNGRPHTFERYRRGLVSGRIEPVWNEWFEQKLIYEPDVGILNFYIDGKKQCEFEVGKFSELFDEPKFKLKITPWGNYPNHAIEIDDIKILQ